MFKVYRDQALQFRWRLVARNGKIIADSGESYTTRGDAREAAQRVKTIAPDADIEDEY